MISLFQRKPIAAETDRGLIRQLSGGDLIMLAIGAVIGAGIFGAIGSAAAGEVDAAGHVIRTGAGPAMVLSFVLAGQKTEEVGSMLDKEGIAVRSGHHCAQPILRRFGLEATVRASLAPYNTCEDIDALVAALHRIQAGRATHR